MDVGQMDDLKQFIDSRISQSEALINDRIDGVESKIDKLQTDTNDGFGGIGEAIEESNNLNDASITDINTRLTKLETKAA